jgi:hypothetical protein
MSTENPYASPGIFSRQETVEGRPAHAARILATFQWNSDLYIEALERCRRQHRERHFVLVLKVLVLVSITPFVISWIWQGKLLPALLITTPAAFLFFMHKLQDWVNRRSFLKEPCGNETMTIEFSESGFHAISPTQDAKLQWCAFTKVVHFQDGFLLFQGPRLVHWIPVSSISDPTQVHQLETLLAAKVAEHKVVEQVALPIAAPPLTS